MWEYTIDIYHTLYYAAGYLFKQVQPRMAVINHYESGGPALDAESVAEVRATGTGCSSSVARIVQVINVTKDAIWSREAALPEERGARVAWIRAGSFPPGEKLPETIELPQPTASA